MKGLSLILLFLGLLANASKGQSLSFSKQYYVKERDTLPYRILYPEGYRTDRQYPIVLFLHGSGARGADNERPLSNVPPVLFSPGTRARYKFVLLVPQCASGDSWAAFPEFPNSLRATPLPSKPAYLTMKLIDDLIEARIGHSSRIYVAGYSMGGEGVLDILSRRPGFFAAGIAVCPVGDTSKAAITGKTPIWIFHGEADSVNHVIYSRMMVAAFREHGAVDFRYSEYPGMGHKCWNKAFNEPALLPWLFKHMNKGNKK